MRFAYIDSQGNEVTIPSIDALALRIELGAIGSDTQLYDAQADRWGPAHTHEIFHTLSRDVAGEAGFVAPPPPQSAEPEAELPADEPAAPEDLAPEPEAPAVAPAEAPARPVFDVAGDLGLAPPEAPPVVPAPEDDADDLGFDFALAEPLAVEGAEPADEGGMDLGMDLDLDLGMVPPATSPTSPTAPVEPVTSPPEESGAFDFGDLGSLELEAEPTEDEPEPAAPSKAPPAGGGGGAMSFGGGMDHGMELEQPMSEFTPDAPPSWMEQSGDADAKAEEDDGGMRFDRAETADDEEDRPARTRPAGRALDDDGTGRRERPEPKNRPSPPKRVSRGSPAGTIGAVVVVALLGAGGWFGWQAFGNGRAARPAATNTPELPPVTIPDIPAEFLPAMRDMGEAALGGMIAELSASRAEVGIPAEPNGDWLAGVYLANASQFRDIQEYWQSIGGFVEQVRDRDTEVFHEQYVVQLEQAGMVGDTAAMLLARADSGFLATRADRFEVYAQMDDLVNAALNLHRFLLSNEAAIEYAPAAGGVSRDPVLEAVPASKALGDEMWDMVDDITEALDQLGTLDKVTTERLSAVLFDRIRRAGFR